MVELMVGANANPLLAAANGDTAYSLAAKRHRVALVIAEACAVHAIELNDMPALLKSIENGAYVNIHNAAGWTPLIYAVSQGNVEAVQFLLRHGAEADRQVCRNLRAEEPPQLSSSCIDCHIRILYISCLLKTYLVLLALSLLLQENDGWTALHFAASTGNEALVKLLLQAGASAGIRTGVAGDGLTAKQLAAEEGFAEVAALIPDVVEQEL